MNHLYDRCYNHSKLGWISFEAREFTDRFMKRKLKPMNMSRLEMWAYRIYKGVTPSELSDYSFGIFSADTFTQIEKGMVMDSVSVDNPIIQRCYIECLGVAKRELSMIRSTLEAHLDGMDDRSRTIPAEIKNKVYKKYNYCCAACGNRESLHIHHKIKFSNGGLHRIDNLVLLCSDCHAEEHQGEREYNLIKSISEKLRTGGGADEQPSNGTAEELQVI